MENKRFRFSGNTHILDTETDKKFYAPCEDDLLDLLNSLSDENEQYVTICNTFTKENEQLKQSIDNLMDSDAWWEKKATERVEELEKENEQLKKIIKDHLEYNPILDELGLLE